MRIHQFVVQPNYSEFYLRIKFKKISRAFGPELYLTPCAFCRVTHANASMRTRCRHGNVRSTPWHERKLFTCLRASRHFFLFEFKAYHRCPAKGSDTIGLLLAIKKED